jgi:hypothetical protein
METSPERNKCRSPRRKEGDPEDFNALTDLGNRPVCSAAESKTVKNRKFRDETGNLNLNTPENQRLTTANLPFLAFFTFQLPARLSETYGRVRKATERYGKVRKGTETSIQPL